MAAAAAGEQVASFLKGRNFPASGGLLLLLPHKTRQLRILLVTFSRAPAYLPTYLPWVSLSCCLVPALC